MEDQIDINDKLVRIIGIQFFGIVIPNATGLISSHDRSVTFLLLTYLYFMLIAFLIWQGNRFLLFKLEEKYNWFINPTQKVVMILGANVFYTAPLVVLMLLGWYELSAQPVDWAIVKITAITCVVCVIFITHAYETVFLIKQRQSDKLKNEQAERARVQAELEVLKNQIDPHFMFNSLNSLSYLIEKSPSRACEFTESLADVYRYILSNKNQKLVMLEDELTFLNKYISLLRLRFESTLAIDLCIDKNNFLIPPISIFIALENVVKHNEISRRHPMKVDITLENNTLMIANKIKERRIRQHSSKIGLANLSERFRIIIGQDIRAGIAQGYFRLSLPLLPINSTA